MGLWYSHRLPSQQLLCPDGGEVWDQMHHSYDFIGIQEPKSGPMYIGVGEKSDLVHLSCVPAALSIRRVKTEPTYKEHILLQRWAKSSLSLLTNHKMVYPNDSGMPVWECWVAICPIFMRQDHDVCLMGLGRLFYPACVVCGGPEPNGLVIIYSVFINDNAITILMCEMVLVPIVWGPFDACQQMVDKARPELLVEGLY
jgi:hypothetical protein